MSNKTSSDKSQKIVKIIEKAIGYGAPIYNQGQHFACAAIYEVAISSVLHLGDLPINMQETLQNALLKGKQTRSATQRAWTYRYAMDSVYTKLKR